MPNFSLGVSRRREDDGDELSDKNSWWLNAGRVAAGRRLVAS